MQLERSLSDNTVEAYLHDVGMLEEYMLAEQAGIGIHNVELKQLSNLNLIFVISVFEYTSFIFISYSPY